MDKRNLITWMAFVIFGLAATGQSAITRYEWWFDDAIDDAVLTTVSPSTHLELNGTFPLTGLETGLHSFHIRFFDDSARSSSIISRFFFIAPEQELIDPEMVVCEWWLDDQTGDINIANLNPESGIHWNETLNLSGLGNGLHSIHVRFQDNTGSWSSIESRFFYKQSFEQQTDKNIISCQYWVDDDMGTMTTVDLEPGQDLIWSSGLELSQLSPGLHTLNLRFKDDGGQWSVPLSRFFIKPDVPASSNPEIILFRYWIDDDFELAEEHTINSPAALVDISEMIDLTHIWKGEHVLHFQTRDNQGLWSAVKSDSVYKQSLPVAAFEYTPAVYCDSTVVAMHNLSIDGDVSSWDFGDGNTSTIHEPVHTYPDPGDYTISLTVTDTLTLQDSTITQTIEVASGVTYGSLNPVVCDSYLSPSGNHTWNASGLYYDTLVNAAGCDSIITVDLTILNSSSSNITETSCDSCLSPSGLYTWTTSGIYYDTLINAAGCDSVIVVDLTIYQTTYAQLDESTCDAYVSPSGNYTWDETGTYFDTIPNAAGCDSIITLHLTVVAVDTSVTNMDPVLIANAENAEYQWIDCTTMEIVPGATGQSFTATMNGTYAVIVSQEGCTDTSSCYTILSVEIGDNPFEDGIHVFPNPTGGSVTLELENELKEVMIFVRNKEGKLVVSKLLYNIKKTKLQIPGPPGQYTLEILSKEGEKAVLKVIRN